MLYEKLRYCRKELHLKAKNLAKVLKIDVSSYYKKERGEAKICMDEAKILAELFDCTMEYLFFDDIQEFSKNVSSINSEKISYRKLKYYRQQLKVEKKKIAKILGISENVYTFKENGKLEFQLSEAIILSKYFDCSIEHLFYDDMLEFSKNVSVNIYKAIK